VISDAPRTARFGTPRRTTKSRTDATLRARGRFLRGEVGLALGLTDEELVPEDPFLEFGAEAFSELAQRCVAELTPPTSVTEAAGEHLVSLALDLHQLALELDLDEYSVRTGRLSDCVDALGRLRTLPSSRDLLEAVCKELVSRCDFGRAVLSRVEAGTWVPMSAHFADADESWFEDFAERGIPLHGYSPEARMLTERLPALVYDTDTAPVHREIIVESGQSSSYVVAPLMAAGDVVGFLHADHFPSARRVDETDRDVMWAFTAGFTRIHERMVLLERVQAQRTEVEEVVGAALRGISTQPQDNILGAGQTLVAGQREALAELTARETEVLHLIVAGATNQVIATELVIAQDTVKSHVKQILRKLGVSNRAQVIAYAAGTSLL
jgi:DNA-binding CsgD family transcriptional regulator